MNILFVCRHNVSRSRIAEAYFKKTNKNPKIKVKSAGLFPGNVNEKSHLDEIKICSKMGLNIRGNSKPITLSLLKKWQDLIIIVADDVPVSIFTSRSYAEKTKVWKIKDAWKIRDYHGSNQETIQHIVKQIMKRVDKLVEELK